MNKLNSLVFSHVIKCILFIQLFFSVVFDQTKSVYFREYVIDDITYTFPSRYLLNETKELFTK